jgi:hypothetical protein
MLGAEDAFCEQVVRPQATAHFCWSKTFVFHQKSEGRACGAGRLPSFLAYENARMGELERGRPGGRRRGGHAGQR